MVTINDIARVSGVSRGTVDRVLNGRGRVSDSTIKHVKKCAEQLGYRPNIAGKALAARKKAFVIGIVLNSVGNPFFDDIIHEIERLADEYSHYGITVKLVQMKGFKAQQQLQMLQQLEGVSALILTPINDTLIAKRLCEFKEQGVPVITLNTDIQNGEGFYYVGSDYGAGGRIAAGVMRLLRNVNTIGIVNGSAHVYGHMQRLEGFTEEISDTPIGIAHVCEGEDDDEIAFERTKDMLIHHPEIDSVFVVAAGVEGVCRACNDTGRDFAIVTFDETPGTLEYLRQGVIKATISQQPRLQGQKAMEVVFNLLVKNEQPPNNAFIVQNSIRIKQNF